MLKIEEEHSWKSTFKQNILYCNRILQRGRHGRSWIYNYLCNQCLSPLKLWVRTTFMEIPLQHYVIKFVSDLRQVGCFHRGLHQYNWPPRYSWNIVERDVKHHKPNKTKPNNTMLYYTLIDWYEGTSKFIVPLGEAKGNGWCWGEQWTCYQPDIKSISV